jgi:hypothetical protein
MYEAIWYFTGGLFMSSGCFCIFLVLFGAGWDWEVDWVSEVVEKPKVETSEQRLVWYLLP